MIHHPPALSPERFGQGASARDRAAIRAVIPKPRTLRPDVRIEPGQGAIELVDTWTRAGFCVEADLDDPDPTLWQELSRYALVSEGLSRKEVRRRQIVARLQDLLELAVTRVPFYRDAAHRYDPSGVRSLEDLSRLPLMRKRDLRAHLPHGLVADGVDLNACISRRELGFAATSGTGEERTQALVDLRLGSLPDDYELLWDIEPLGRPLRMAILTTPICTGSVCHLGESTYEDRRVGETGLFLRSTADLFSLSDEQAREIADDWRRFQPDVVFANPVYLQCLGRRLRGLGIPLPVAPRIVSSFQLLSRVQRRALERMFGVTVYDNYGATDAGRLAVECSHGHLHVREDHTLLEIVDPSGNPLRGGVGAVAVTTLENHAAPLVRYLVGDLGRWTGETCPCAFSAWPSLELHGRAQEVLATPRGTFTTRQVDDALSAVPGIDFYQCQQLTANEALLLVVPSPDVAFDEPAARQALAALGLSPVRVREVRRLDPERSLKYSLVKTRLAAPAEAS